MVLSDKGLLSVGKSSMMYDSPNLEGTNLALSLPDFDPQIGLATLGLVGPIVPLTQSRGNAHPRARTAADHDHL